MAVGAPEMEDAASGGAGAVLRAGFGFGFRSLSLVCLAWTSSKSKSSRDRLHCGPPFENRERWGILSYGCTENVGQLAATNRKPRQLWGFGP
jgi:hypothetical protein